MQEKDFKSFNLVFLGKKRFQQKTAEVYMWRFNIGPVALYTDFTNGTISI